MSEQWRILVVEDDEQINLSIVNSLRKDGYLIQGVRSGAEAIRMLWSEEFDVVIGDLKTPGADGFELLQWLRAFRPGTRMVMIAAAGSASTRAQALEAGVVSYLEKPLNLHLLKEELRRLLQQTGFSANLDSFDLLDVIQIVTMSRKNIALLVNTGPEERGTLRFQGGELIWAEYGMLHGEEAFFALAAYKNGTVVHQPWDDQVAPNVTQPLSRLIFQALQYRARYGVLPQSTGEQPAIPRVSASQLLQEAYEVDDSPLQTLVEEHSPVVGVSQPQAAYMEAGKEGKEGKEWWQQTGKRPGLPSGGDTGKTDNAGSTGNTGNTEGIESAGTTGSTQPFPDTIAKTPILPPRRSPAHNGHSARPSEKQTDGGEAGEARPELPAWLTEQQSPTERRTLRPSALSNTAQMPKTPGGKPSSSAEWQPPTPSPRPITKQPTEPITRTTDPLSDKEATGPRRAVPTTGKTRRPASPEWQPPASSASSVPPVTAATEPVPPSVVSGPLQSLVPTKRNSGKLASDGSKESGEPEQATVAKKAMDNGPSKEAIQRRPPRRNYPALVAALQTLGYSITGFIAAAVVAMDGQPVAQVAIDDLDISHLCKHFSVMLEGALQSLEQRQWGVYEHMVITSANSHILLNVVGDAASTGDAWSAFLVLITTHEANPAESLEVMANVEGAIGAALK